MTNAGRMEFLRSTLGGVQGRHYDQHEYMDEKRNALKAWADHLQALADRKLAVSNVRKLNRAGQVGPRHTSQINGKRKGTPN